ncbi:unnamed protein product [Oikopleura dioica]|uniref:Major facilitator superfamily (MFS) profile domain-containing protein n=1 Tax=Oikopleura dioica TaxID=34765 RepID=E4X8Y3_OIKDI|nr:unnamed protein product [Oikopleura dioica]
MSNSYDRTFLFLGIAWVRTLCGLFIATTSISIPVLAHNVESDLGTTSWMFTFRIFGAFLGGVLGSTCAKQVNPNKIFAVATFVAAVALYWTPSITSLTVLLLVCLLFGTIHGLVDSIGQIIILEHALKPGLFILGFHALFTFGSILGALLVRVFLDPSLEQPCPNDPEHHKRIVLLPEVLNSFQYAFIVPAYALFAAVIIQFIQVYLSTYEKVNVPKTSMSETAINEPIRPSKIFLVFYIGTLFFAATSYQVTFSFLHPFTRCDDYLQVSSEESATNVIWYWFANMLGRFFIMYLLNKKYNVRKIFTSVASLLLLIQLILEFAPLPAYVFMALEDICGFLLSGVIPLCIVYASSQFDLCEGYMWTIYVGCNLLCMFNPVAIGFWMTIDNRGFVHALLIACASLLLFQQLMFHSAKTINVPAEKSSSGISLSAISSAISIKI